MGTHSWYAWKQGRRTVGVLLPAAAAKSSKQKIQGPAQHHQQHNQSTAELGMRCLQRLNDSAATVAGSMSVYRTKRNKQGNKQECASLSALQADGREPLVFWCLAQFDPYAFKTSCAIPSGQSCSVSQTFAASNRCPSSSSPVSSTASAANCSCSCC